MKRNATDHQAEAGLRQENVSAQGSGTSEESDLRGIFAGNAIHQSGTMYARKMVMAVDLGLPSGTCWAYCNVGATKPEEYGNHYAWGETEVKDYYGWDNYTFQGCERSLFHDPSMSICGTNADVARDKWGGRWQMPTLEQVKELVDICAYRWATLKGVPGGEFTGPNGGSIFLPAAGYRWFDRHNCAGVNGCYWLSTQGSKNPHFACSLSIYTERAYLESESSRGGFSVRPVFLS